MTIHFSQFPWLAESEDTLMICHVADDVDPLKTVAKEDLVENPSRLDQHPCRPCRLSSAVQTVKKFWT